MNKKSRVLYVDDEKDNLIGFKYMFREYYEILTAESAKEACEIMAREEGIDLVIADQRMPKMTGVELFAQLIEEYPDTIRMILTGYSDIEAVIGAINKGQVYHYFKKPWEEAEVRMVIDQALETLALRRGLDKQKELHRSLAENLGDWAWEVDANGRYTYISAQVTDFLGYTPDELLGRTPFDLMPSDEAERTQSHFIDLVSKKAAIRDLENWNLTKDGRRVCMLTSGVPVLDEEGTLLGYRGIDRDITETKNAVEEIQKLSMAVHQAAEIILITDCNGIIEYVNPAFEEATGYTSEEVVGGTPRILKSGHHDDLFYQEIWRRLSSGHVWRGRFDNKRKDGSIYTEDAVISPVRREDGTIIKYVGVKHDITNQLRMEEEFRLAQKMEAIGRLAGGVAHDFNNIMQSILGFCGILQSSLNKSSSEYSDVFEIRKAALRAGDLTRQLLALGRNQPIDYVMSNLNDLVSDNEKMLTQVLGGKVSLSLDLDENLEKTRFNSSQIEQVILNLVVNARDAMPEGGTITVATRNVRPGEEIAFGEVAQSQMVCLSVADTGCGIRSEVLEHLFEPFYTTKQVGKGTGMGLAVVYGVVTQHDGQIKVESELDEGSVFNVFLPTLNPKYSPNSEDIHPEGRGEHILGVALTPFENSPLKYLLEEAGYSVSEAVDFQGGVKALEEDNGFSLILFSCG
ncbi:MAG TPA: PAS domain S-box protein, partial [Pontiella sp.]